MLLRQGPSTFTAAAAAAAVVGSGSGSAHAAVLPALRSLPRAMNQIRAWSSIARHRHRAILMSASVPRNHHVENRVHRLHTSTSLRKANRLYELLGVTPDASQGELKKAYYKLAKKYHPDANPGDEAKAKKFADISAAYETLGDESTRAQYDAAGGYEPGEGPQGGFGGFGGGGGGGGFQNPEDLFESIFGSMGGRGRGGAGRRRGADVQTELEIDFLDAVSGIKRSITYSNRVRCDTCSGSGETPGSNSRTVCPTCAGSGVETMSVNGFMQYQSTCRKCGGTGSIIADPCKPCRGRGFQELNQTIDVEIPAGVDDGMELRLLDRGHAGENGGPAGSLFVVIRVRPSNVFDRQGSDVFSTVKINIAQALLGGSVPVKGITGDMNLKLKSGTEIGKQSRLRGRGMPRLNSSSRGDHYVTYQLDVPRNMTQHQKNLILEWASLADPAAGTIEGLDEFIASQQTQDESDKDCDDTFLGSIFGSSSKCKDKDGKEEVDDQSKNNKGNQAAE